MFEHEVVKMFASVFTSDLYTLAFHYLDRLIENFPRIGSISALDVSPYEQFN